MSMNTADLARCIASGSSDPVKRYPDSQKWWAYLELNQGPRPYQGRALTN